VSFHNMPRCTINTHFIHVGATKPLVINVILVNVYRVRGGEDTDVQNSLVDVSPQGPITIEICSHRPTEEEPR
jgi:hypothetical protein